MCCPNFANPIVEWKDKMIHRDINGIPWMWIEFAGMNDNDEVYSQWVGVFDK
jgi:phage gp37-like protein